MAKDLGSDKYFWHRYTDFYGKFFNELDDVQSIVEFGVFHGDSIRWLSSEFPQASIAGADILPHQVEWPESDKITYWKLDQDRRDEIRQFFDNVARHHQLVIEDGSHIPAHQRNTLIAALPWMSKGGVYILEDLHTSASALRKSGGISSPAAQRIWTPVTSKIMRVLNLNSFKFRITKRNVNCLTLVLAIERARAQGRNLDKSEVKNLCTGGFFTSNEVMLADLTIATVDIYKRNTLPLACYRCGGTSFDLARLRCNCGTPLYQDDDSMTAVLTMIR